MVEVMRILVEEFLEEMSDGDLVEVHNKANELTNSSQYDIYPNDKDNIRMLVGDCPHNALQMAFYGDYRPLADYVVLNGSANLETFNDVYNHVTISEIVEVILEYPHEFTQWVDIQELEDEIEE